MKVVIDENNAYAPAMEIKDQANADAYFDALVELAVRKGVNRARAILIQRQNLGYFAGYYEHATRVRVEKLFRCTHPIFGAAADYKPSSDEAFALGVEFGKIHKKP